jgi:hypothetical protein
MSDGVEPQVTSASSGPALEQAYRPIDAGAIDAEFNDLLNEAEKLLAQIDPVNTGGFGARGTLAVLLLKLLERVEQGKPTV